MSRKVDTEFRYGFWAGALGLAVVVAYYALTLHRIATGPGNETQFLAAFWLLFVAPFPSLVFIFLLFLTGIGVGKISKLSLAAKKVFGVLAIVGILLICWTILSPRGIDIAIERADVRYCRENIITRTYHAIFNDRESGYEDKCYHQFAVNKTDESICDNIKSYAEKADCYSDVALAKKEPPLCKHIQDEDIKDMCYVRLASETLNTSLCDRIAQEFYYNRCYEELAIASQDPSFCDMMNESDYVKRGCYSEVYKASSGRFQ